MTDCVNLNNYHQISIIPTRFMGRGTLLGFFSLQEQKDALLSCAV